MSGNVFTVIIALLMWGDMQGTVKIVQWLVAEGALLFWPSLSPSPAIQGEPHVHSI